MASPASNQALLAAIDARDAAAVARALADGADPDARSEHDQHALMLACFEDDLEILRLLLDAGADVDAVDGEGVPALVVALEHEDLAMMDLLIERGADLRHICDDDGKNTILSRALDQGEVAKASPEVVARLLRAGADPNQRNGRNSTALIGAAWYPDPALTQLLLDAGAHVDAPDGANATALYIAASQRHFEVVKRLIAAGADVNHMCRGDGVGNTVLTRLLDSNETMACDLDDDGGPSAEMLALLLGAGADPNLANEDGWPPLHYAAAFATPRLVETLIAAGANVRGTRKRAYAIDVADFQGHAAVVERLVALGSPTLAAAATERSHATWQDILAWTTAHAPRYAAKLAAAVPATPAEIAALERALGAALPFDFVAYLARYGGEGPGAASFYRYDGISVDEIARRWQLLCGFVHDGTFAKLEPRELDKDADEIQWAWWHRGWIPFADDNGHLYCIDLAPGPQGHGGQVIKWEKGSGPVGPMASSFEEFLDQYLARMRKGVLEYDGDTLALP